MISTAILYISLSVYHEARGEPLLCQLYVAETVRNRMESRQMTAKQVVRERNQFSWTRIIKQKTIRQEFKRLQRTVSPADKESLERAIVLANWVNSPLYHSFSGAQYFYDTSINTPKYIKQKITCGGKLVFSK